MANNTETYQSYVETGNFFNKFSSSIYKSKGNSMELINNYKVQACGCGTCETFKVLYWTSNDLLGCHAFSEHCLLSFKYSPFRVPILALTTFNCNVKKETQFYWVSKSVLNTSFVESDFDLKAILPRIFKMTNKGEFATIKSKFFNFNIKMSEDIAGYTMPKTTKEEIDYARKMRKLEKKAKKNKARKFIENLDKGIYLYSRDLQDDEDKGNKNKKKNEFKKEKKDEFEELLKLILTSQKIVRDRTILNKIIYTQKARMRMNSKIVKDNFNLSLLKYKKFIYICSEIFSFIKVPLINRLSNSEAIRLNVKIIRQEKHFRANVLDKRNLTETKEKMVISTQKIPDKNKIIAQKIKEYVPDFEYDELTKTANYTPKQLKTLDIKPGFGFNKFFIDNFNVDFRTLRTFKIMENVSTYKLYSTLINIGSFRVKSKILKKKEFEIKLLDLNYNINHRIINFVRHVSGLPFKTYKRNKSLDSLIKMSDKELVGGRDFASYPIQYFKRPEHRREINDLLNSAEIYKKVFLDKARKIRKNKYYPTNEDLMYEEDNRSKLVEIHRVCDELRIDSEKSNLFERVYIEHTLNEHIKALLAS